MDFRTKRFLNDRNIVQRVEDRIDNRSHKIRQRPSKFLKRKIPRVGSRNVGQGLVIGAIEAGVAVVLEDTVGVPFGASSEVVDVEPTQGGQIYTVNVNAPIENMAEARAFIESTTGFSSIITDVIDVQSTEVLNTRVLRDTYQIEILVQD